MLKMLRQVKSVWIKNIGSNIIVMIMICLTCYLGSGVFNQVVSQYRDYVYFKDTPFNRSLVFLGREAGRVITENGMYRTVDTQYMKKMVEIADSSSIVKGISHMLKFGTGNSQTDVIIYDEITASYVKNTTTLEGSWIFEKGKNEVGYYPVTVYKGNYDIGDVIDIYINLEMKSQPNNGFIPGKTVSVKAQVVGKIYDIDPFVFYLGAVKGNTPASDSIGDLFDTGGGLVDNIIFFPYCDELFHDYAYSNDTAVFYFNEGASNSDIDNFYMEAQSLGYCCLGSEIIDTTKKTSDLVFRRNFFAYFSSLGLMLTSIVCISFLNLKKVKKDFSVYYLNGCSLKKSAAIYFIYFVLLYAISFIASIIITEFQKLIYRVTAATASVYEYKTMFLFSDYRVIFFTCIIGIAVSMLSTVIPFIIIKRKTPIQNIKET